MWFCHIAVITKYQNVLQLNSLRERLSEVEAERDRLLAELEELRAAQVSGVTCDSEDAEDSDDMLDFPGEPRTLAQKWVEELEKVLEQIKWNISVYVVSGAEKLLSKQSRGLDADSPAEGTSQENPAMVEQLHRKVEELTSQNADLVLKVQVEFLSFKHTFAECKQSTKAHTHTEYWPHCLCLDVFSAAS